MQRGFVGLVGVVLALVPLAPGAEAGTTVECNLEQGLEACGVCSPPRPCEPCPANQTADKCIVGLRLGYGVAGLGVCLEADVRDTGGVPDPDVSYGLHKCEAFA